MSNIPQIMEAVLADGYGDPEVLHIHTAPVPAYGVHEVLIKVAAAGVNRADTLQRKGHYDPPEGVTEVLGLEAAGEVVAVGANVQRWKRGDKVAALLSGGGYAEYVAAPEGQCLPWPQDYDAHMAAALPECLFTVWANLFETGKLKAGETALIHGGAGGIGSFAIQAARAFGAKVFTTAGAPEKIQICKSLGADLVISYREKDFVQEITEFTKGRGVDVVLDMIGGDYLARSVEVLAPLGRYVAIATQRGRRGDLDIGAMMARRLTISGSTLRSRSVTEKSRIAREVEAHLWPLLEKKLVKPLIFQSFPLDKAAEAHKVMENGAHSGKIILAVA